MGLAVIYVTGLIDDIFGVKAKKKFNCTNLCVISTSNIVALHKQLVWLYGHTQHFFLGGSTANWYLYWYLLWNATNLIDGIDGLSASLSFIALGGVLLLFSRRRNVDLLHIDSWLNGCLGTFSLL